MNTYESAGMWSSYSKDNKGIAIRSTYKRLRNCLPPWIGVGVMTYIDFEKESLEQNSFFSPFLYKRKAYESEQELRAATVAIDKYALEAGHYPHTQLPGLYEPVSINQLVESVYVAPYSDEWYKDLVVDITIQVNRSCLTESPAV
jgi:hypothetical protein